MPRYQFPGFPAFLDAAAAEIGHPEVSIPARRDTTLAAIGTLCSQAADAEYRHVAEILAKAQELTNQLQATHRAAERMVADVRDGRLALATLVEPLRRNRSTPSLIESRGVIRKHA